MTDNFDAYHVWLGIPPEEQPPDHYRLLGLRSFEKDPDVISNAVDQRRAHLRSVQAGKRGVLSQKLLNEVSAAAVCLLDQDKKKQYDEQLRADLAKNGGVKTPAIPVAAPLGSGEAGGLGTPVVPIAPQAPPTASLLPTSQPSVPVVVDVRPSDPIQIRGAGTGTRPEKSIAAARSTSMMPIVLTVGGVLAVLLIAGAVGIWAMLGKTEPVAKKPGTNPKQTNTNQTNPKQTNSNDNPTVGPETTNNSNSIDNSTNPPSTTPQTGPTTTNVSAAPAGQRQTWLAEGTEPRVLREIGGRWVEFQPQEEHGYNLTMTSPDFIQLHDPTRGVDLRAYADRLEVKTMHQDWAVLASGKWVEETSIPEFARRQPKSAYPSPRPWRGASRHALVFGGRESLRLPLPAEIVNTETDFTLEMWVRYDREYPDAHLIDMGGLTFATTKSPQPNRFANIDLKARSIGLAGASPLQPNQWMHVALIRNGENLQIYIDGKPLAARVPLRNQFTLGSRMLVVGESPGKPGFHGMIRDLRLSSGARYSERFTPPARFVADDKTLALPKFVAEGGFLLRDQAGKGSDATRAGPRWVPLTDEGEVAAELPGQTVDLLRAISVGTETIRGQASASARSVEVSANAGPAQVLVPYRLPAEYDLDITAMRVEGEGGALIGLLIAGQPVVLAVDAFPNAGRLTGILPADTVNLTPGPALVQQPPIFADGQELTFTVKVRLSGPSGYSITVEQGGRTIVQSQGSISDLTCPAHFQMPLQTAMSIGSLDVKLRYSALNLRTVTAALPAGMLVGTRPPTTNVAVNSTPQTQTINPETTPAQTPNVSSPTRQPVPSTEAREKALTEARNIYQDRFKQATKAPQKAMLAKDIRTAGKETQGDQTARYVLIDLARKVFIQAGEVQEAIDTAKQLETDYEIPPNTLLAETLEQLNDATIVMEQRAPLATAAADLADQFVSAGDFGWADKLSAVAVQSAAKQREAELKKDVQQRRNVIARMVKEWNTVKPHLETLKTSPDDATANLAVGKFHALVDENWSVGSAHLAKGGDPIFAEPAKLDAAASDAAGKLAAAEAWLKLAGETKVGSKDDKLAVQRRAKALFTEAAEGLSGLDRVKAEKRLEELKDVEESKLKSLANRRSRESDVAGSGLVGRVLIAGRDSGIMVSYEPGSMISGEEIARLQGAGAAMPNTAWRIEMVGMLTLPADSMVEVWHVGGSSFRGIHRLFIDGRPLSEVGDDRTKNDTQRINLKKGKHTILWTLSGGDLGSALVRFTPLDASGNPQDSSGLVTYTSDMQSRAKTPTPRIELKLSP